MTRGQNSISDGKRLNEQIKDMIESSSESLDDLFYRGPDATKILDVMLQERLVDDVLALKSLISQPAAEVLDATHLSQSIHAVLASDFYSCDLLMPERPARTLKEVGFFHYTNILRTPWIDRDEGKKIPWKAKIKKLFLRTVYPGLNFLVRLKCLFGNSSVGFGELYNLEPKLTLKSILHLSIQSLTGSLLRIDSEVSTFQLPSQPLNHPINSGLRQTLSDQIFKKLNLIESLSEKYDTNFLAKYIAMSIPMSHFEMRQENYKSAILTAKKYKLRAIVSAIGLMTDAAMVFFAAAARELNATKLIGVQHGGYYGYVRGHNHNYNAEYRVFDAYLTWGWDTKSHFYGPMRARCLPFGSPYLGQIRRQFPMNSYWTATQSPNPRVLLVSGPFVEAGARCEGQLGGHIDRNHIFPVNALAIAQFCKKINATEVHLKGGYPASLEPEYFAAIEDSCKQSNVRYKVLPTHGSAMQLLSQYDIILLDSIGTTFFESIALEKSTLLLPSALIAPQRENPVDVDPSVYVHNLLDQPIEDLSLKIKASMERSMPFITRYGLPTPLSLTDILAGKAFQDFLEDQL